MLVITLNPNAHKIKAAIAAALVLCLVVFVPGLSARELTDANIENAVERQLLSDQAVPAYRITVESDNGIVSLAGTVGNILAKERARNVTEAVKGVRSVVNMIQVSPYQDKSPTRVKKDVIEALRMNPATSVFDISVSAEEKKVILEGTVASYREKQLAGTVAKGVSGVTSLENNIKISYPAHRSDRQIQDEIEQGLLWDALVDHALIEVAVENGRVALTGTVGSAAEKTRAMAGAWVSGVKEVDVSGLAVARWARDPDLRTNKYVPKSDEEIKLAIITALTVDPRISNEADITVMVKGGVVTLKGNVDYLQARRAAAQDAKNTVGVLRVRNNLKVAPLPVTLSDTELEEDIKAALDRDAYVDEYDIVVNVRSGVAELYGNVNSHYEKMRAENVASTIAGIYHVNNNIVVDKGWAPYYYNPYLDQDDFPPEDYEWYNYTPSFPGKNDNRIKEDIKEELWWDPFVDSEAVKVEVENGIATLTGTVNSQLEHDAAVENAREGGAVSVNDKLEISPLLPPKKN